MIRPFFGALVAVSSSAQPALQAGGEASLGLVMLWEGKSTGDGFDTHPAPLLSALLGAAVLGPLIGVMAADWTTFGASGGLGPVSVEPRHHVLGLGPHVAFMDRGFRVGLTIQALMDVVSAKVALAGADSMSASGARAGFRYGFESVIRLGTLPITSGLRLGGQRRDGRDDIYLGLTTGWIWGALSPSGQPP